MSSSMNTRRIIVAVTGASGGPYARGLIDRLEAAGCDIHLVVSPWGQRLLKEECAIGRLSADELLGRASERLIVHGYQDLAAPISSGSLATDGMVVCPCSSNTLGQIAAGLGDNLISRAAHVTLKQARRLILVHREMPISGIDLANMHKLQQAGAIICPASPGFYLHPKTVDDLVGFVVGRVLDLLGVGHDLPIRWPPEPRS